MDDDQLLSMKTTDRGLAKMRAVCMRTGQVMRCIYFTASSKDQAMSWWQRQGEQGAPVVWMHMQVPDGDSRLGSDGAAGAVAYLPDGSEHPWPEPPHGSTRLAPVFAQDAAEAARMVEAGDGTHLLLVDDAEKYSLVRLAWNELILRSADDAATWCVISTRRFPVAKGPRGIVQRPVARPRLAPNAPRSNLLIGSGSLSDAIDGQRHVRPVLVYAVASWCGHCTRFTPNWNDAVTEALDSCDAAWLAVDSEGGAALLREYGVNEFPTVLLVSGDDRTPVDRSQFERQNGKIPILRMLSE